MGHDPERINLIRALARARRELAGLRYAEARALDAFGDKWPADACEIVSLTIESLDATIDIIDKALRPHAEITLAVSERPISKDEVLS